MNIINKVKDLDRKLDCFITVDEKSKPLCEGKLSGYTVSVKDCFCTNGLRTTAGSKILENYIPLFDATVVEKVKNEGGLIIGKTAMDEFGFGTFSANCAYKIPKNPWDLNRSCGGSSGGAGCISAVLEKHIAVAESTGGSISAPASFTGTVGITPTYGRCSRWGLLAYANSLDKPGIIAGNVKDAALGLSIIAGYDEKDSTSINEKVPDYTKSCRTNLKGIKIGIPKEYLSEGIDEKVKSHFYKAVETLESLGAKTEKVSLPMTKYALSSYYIIAVSEASTNLAKYCGIRYGATLPLKGNFDEFASKVRTKYFGEEAKRRIMLGTFTRMSGYRDAYYLKAMKIRQMIIDDFKKAFKKVDVLASPTMPVIAPRFDEISKLTPLQNWAMDILTVAPNLAGIPMISVPCGFADNMPVGLHIIGNHLDESKLIHTAYAYEQKANLNRGAEI
ncbi:MAG: Asp-tRNA(Asn)/Glu-tRNA(Gln) amidotransferase subunit GatA [Candidatus Nanoarchaeia archaeon]|nr:Asp-tRNA(Asn)/Glu-tRNA(Gln) amidotransferase subunit GatA [Candidatus Nanoarchaeia archaeon]